MDAVPTDQERKRLFLVLTVVTLASAVALLVTRAHPLVGFGVLAAIGLPWIAFSIYLRLNRDGVGSEGRFVDWWTVPHGIGGLLLGVFDIGLVWVVALVVWWECCEAASRVYEHFTNRVSDVVVALVGWTIAQLVLTSGVRLV
jgi:hypothetical protein